MINKPNVVLVGIGEVTLIKHKDDDGVYVEEGGEGFRMYNVRIEDTQDEMDGVCLVVKANNTCIQHCYFQRTDITQEILDKKKRGKKKKMRNMSFANTRLGLPSIILVQAMTSKKESRHLLRDITIHKTLKHFKDNFVDKTMDSTETMFSSTTLCDRTWLVTTYPFHSNKVV